MQGHVDELQLVHALKLAVVSADRDGRIMFANEAAIGLYGGSDDDLVGHPLTDFVLDTRTPDGGVDALTQVLGGEMWRGDLRIRHFDGTSFVAAVIATPLLSPDREVVGLVVFCEDITGERNATAEADAYIQRLRLAHEAAQLGTWQWEIATGAVVWDERLEAIFGYEPGTFPQTFEAWLGGIHPDDVPEVLEIVNRAMDERSAYLLRTRVVWPDGKTVRSIESWGQVTTDGDGNPTGTIGCLRDVTDEKEIERALEAAHEAQRLATRRTELLLDVTADFSGAATMRQVEEALVSHLREFSLLLGRQAALAVPEQLTEVRSGRDLALEDYDLLPLPDQVLLDGLAAQCRAAAQRAHLMARTSDIAEHLQLSLAASPLPYAEAFELAVHYAPGGDELEHVGGDWYDAVSMPSGSLAMIVGDVMGRGVRAATTMIRVRAGLRGLITVDPWPGHLLAFADELLVRDAPDQFVTAVAALLDPESGELHLCVAGHVPALVVHPDGRTDTLGTGTGIPLGIDPGVTRATQTSMTEPGSIVVLVTDGVVETRGADLDQGIAALRDRAVELRDRPLTELVSGLATLADTSLHDDVTVLAIRRR
jgi:PAS domain S-box-containing protein